MIQSLNSNFSLKSFDSKTKRLAKLQAEICSAFGLATACSAEAVLKQQLLYHNRSGNNSSNKIPDLTSVSVF